MTDDNSEDLVAGRTRALIESRMPQRSLARLERDIGMENLGRRLSQAARSKSLPAELIVAVHNATGITIAELVIAMFDDFGYSEYLPFLTLDTEDVKAVRAVMRASRAERNLVVAYLEWLQSTRSTILGQSGSGQVQGD